MRRLLLRWLLDDKYADLHFSSLRTDIEAFPNLRADVDNIYVFAHETIVIMNALLAYLGLEIREELRDDTTVASALSGLPTKVLYIVPKVAAKPARTKKRK